MEVARRGCPSSSFGLRRGSLRRVFTWMEEARRGARLRPSDYAAAVFAEYLRGWKWLAEGARLRPSDYAAAVFAEYLRGWKRLAEGPVFVLRTTPRQSSLSIYVDGRGSP